MSLQPDQMIAHYRLLEKIGEGGMGVVWKALDTNLDREVAIKVLPEHFAGDSERLARFEREAKLLASLNHTHIASIFGLHEADGQRFLAMELIPGESLDVRLERGTMAVEEALRVALDVAEALEAAHESGVIHRDLKPANIQVSPDGQVKVLDFGLAKAFETETPGASGEASLSPTITSAGTIAGTILGTAAYMSPEQARGRAVDKRTDIWSFGVVLFECLAGKRLFKGESVPDSMGAILHKDPDWTALPADTPERIRELLLRCLDKDARKRLRDIGDARLELEAALGMERSALSGGPATAGTVAPTTLARRMPLIAVAVAAVAGIVAGAGIWSWFSGGPMLAPAARPEVVRLSLDVPDDRTAMSCYISPDGKTLAYRGVPNDTESGEVPRLYLRQLDSFEATPVPGSENSLGVRFSPDNQWMVFTAPTSERSSQRRMMKAPMNGDTPPQALADWDANWREFEWISNDELLILTSSPQTLIRLPATGGAPGAPLDVAPQGFEGKITIDYPLPDGRHVLGTSSVWSDRGWTRRVSVVNLETGEAHILVENGYNPRWSPTGHLLFSRQDTILAAPFDPSVSLDVGGAVAVSQGLRTFYEWSGGSFQLSASGTLAYFPGGVIGSNRKLAYLKDGELEPWADPPRTYMHFLEVSPDGKRVAVTIGNPNGLEEVWVSEIDRPRLRRFAAEPGRDCGKAIWSHDSTRLAYSVSGQGDEGGVYIRSVDGSDPPLLVLAREREGDTIRATSFSADGKQLLIDRYGPPGPRILVRDLDDPEGAAEPLLTDAWMGKVSWDGRWLSYTSDTSGRNEVYIRSLTSDLITGAEIPITTTEGFRARWLKQDDALRLSYQSQREWYIVTITTESEITVSAPESLPRSREIRELVSAGDWLPDGRQFVVLRGEDEKLVDEIRVVINWVEELKARTGSF